LKKNLGNSIWNNKDNSELKMIM